ncbi:MAG: M20/M25/M40 family metallo-hydrolase [Clostridia bacterium]|nr:M20/M25/M40 family metallo-hydrolase [Clostridia bacterium]
MYNTLKTLCLVSSVSGREEAIREKIKEMIAPFTDECTVDNLGNLIAVKHGTGKDKKKLMLCAHMDEIGFIVTFIEENGAVRVSNVGGINLVASSCSQVISERGVRGVLVPESGVKAADFAPDKFLVDIGTKSKKETEKKVRIGDFFVVTPSLSRLCGKRVCGRPIDDRIGCAVMIKTAERLASEKLKDDIYYVFSVQEEVGCRGSKPAAFAVAPDYALVYDVTGTGDTIGAKPMECSLGKGAAIKIKDSSVICSAEVVDMLKCAAEENDIPCQLEILTYGGTDTSSIQMSGFGTRAGALSIPARYIHSGVETIDLSDAEACVSLTLAFIKKL